MKARRTTTNGKLDKILDHIGEIRTEQAVSQEWQRNTTKDVEFLVKAMELQNGKLVNMDERMDKVEQWRSKIKGQLAVIGTIGIPVVSVAANYLYKRLSE